MVCCWIVCVGGMLVYHLGWLTWSAHLTTVVYFLHIVTMSENCLWCCFPPVDVTERSRKRIWLRVMVVPVPVLTRPYPGQDCKR